MSLFLNEYYAHLNIYLIIFIYFLKIKSSKNFQNYPETLIFVKIFKNSYKVSKKTKNIHVRSGTIPQETPHVKYIISASGFTYIR